MFKNIRLVIFDLDGTLVDSLEDITAGVNHVMLSEGLEELDASLVKRYVGRGVSTLIRKCFGDAATDRNVAEGVLKFREYYIDHCVDATRCYDGVIDTLDFFSAKLKMAMVTNKPFDSAKAISDRLGISPYMEQILGADSLERKKPDPLPINYAMEKAGSVPNSTIIVGDSSEDISGGKNAGIFTCGVTYGIGNPDEMARSGPDCVIDGITELKDLILPL